MKTATFPSVRVEPELREAAESVLQEGESLSSFVEQAIRENIVRRQRHSEFVARGLASRDDAKRSGDYIAADEVLSRLSKRLDAAKARSKKRR
jgi:predicted transcriptional regulator